MAFRKPRSLFDLFNEFFDSVFSDFDEAREFEEDEPILEPKPLRNVSGFSVRISSVPGAEPKVEVQRFGPEGAQGMQPVQPQRVRAEPRVIVEEQTGEREETVPNVKFEKPEVVEGTGQRGKFVELHMPDIESPEQVHLNILEESVEVKAVNKEKRKGYFWIVKLPNGTRQVTKGWGKGKFILYFT